MISSTLIVTFIEILASCIGLILLLAISVLIFVGISVLISKLKFNNNNKEVLNYAKETNTSQNQVDYAVLAAQPFVNTIDEILKDYLEYDVIRKLRDEAATELKKAYLQSPQEFSNFANSVNRRLWAYKYICSITLDELGTGKHHLRDVLTPNGRVLRKVNEMCLNEAFANNYINKEELDEALAALDNNIREIGKWA